MSTEILYSANLDPACFDDKNIICSRIENPGKILCLSHIWDILSVFKSIMHGCYVYSLIKNTLSIYHTKLNVNKKPKDMLKYRQQKKEAVLIFLTKSFYETDRLKEDGQF